MPTKILAIDDSKTMRLAIKITFAAEDAKVTAVSKGSEAVARAKQMQADVILIDHNLAPGEPSGFEVVQALKSNPATAKIPVIMMVPTRGGISEADITAAGANDFIGKPFESQDLIDKVGLALGKTPAPRVKPERRRRAPKAAAKPPVAAAKPPVPAAKPPVARPAAKVATPPPAAVRPPVAAKPARAPAARTPAPARTPARTPAPARAPAPTPAPRPVAARTPAPAAARAPARAPTSSPAAAPGKIPIAVPIPFTSASSPTPGMLERLRGAASNGSAVAGIDPNAVQALLRLTDEVLMEVVWEVVPELAEEMIKQKMQ